MRLPALCLLLACALPASAEIYRSTDAQGNPVFSDRPLPGASRVELPADNRMDSPQTTAVPAPGSAEPEGVPAYQQLRISQPAPDANLRSNDGSLSVSLSSQPALQPGHRYRLLLDGQAQGSSTSPQFRLHNLDRGSHSLAAEIVDADGRVLARSPSQSVHLQRHSVQHTRPTPSAKPPQP